MAKKATIIIEKANDGGYSCYMDGEVGGFALYGYGRTAKEAKEDLLEAYEETKQIKEEEGESMPDLRFEFRYDMQSFFNYFSFLNMSKVAEIAGINASQMRQYAGGLARASQKQYDKMQSAVKTIAKELSTATF